MKRFVTIAMAAVILLSGIMTAIGCTKVPDTPSGETTAPASDSVAQGDVLPDVFYDGYEFRVGLSNPYGYDEVAPLFDDEEPFAAGSMDEAVYRRNERVKNAIGVTVAAHHVDDWQNMLDAIQTVVLSGEDDFEAYCGSVYYQFQSSISNFLYDLKTISTMDLSRKWWDQELADMYSLKSNHLYYIGGDINYCDDYGQSVLFFNSTLMKEHQMETPYEDVRNGTWTLDRLLGYMKNFASDNGDSVWDENDTYGGVFTIGQLSIMLCGFGTTMIQCEGPGELRLNESKPVFDQVSKIMDGIYSVNNQDVVICERVPWGYTAGTFQNGQALFTASTIGAINSYRFEMAEGFDFGIVPYPKYSEEQAQYYCVFDTPWATAYSVMSHLTAENAARAGIILEYMGSFSRDTVYQSAVETNAKTKSARDDDTAEMIDLVFKSKIYEIGLWPTKIYSATNTMAARGVNSWAALIAANRDAVKAEYADVASYYAD